MPTHIPEKTGRQVRRFFMPLAPLAFGALLFPCGPVSASVAPGRESGVMGQLVVKIVETSHYARRPVGDEASRQALRLYIDSLDYNHMVFQKSDLDWFEAAYTQNLDDRIKIGDTAPAFDIFNRFLDRMEKRFEWAQKLTAESYDFSTEETMLIDRREAPWPANDEQTLDLWRQRIKHEILLERLNGTKPEEQAKAVRLRYERLLRGVREYDSEDVLQSYLSAFAHTYDPHSDYMAAPEKENFDINMSLSLVGIGAILRSEDGYAKVVSLVPGGPADKDKRLKPNDRIEAVAQGEGSFVDTVGMKLDRVVQMIRGKKGTTVRLKVIPAETPDSSTRLVVSLVREEIKLTDQEAKAKILQTPWQGRTFKIGVIELPSFYSDMQSGGELKSTTRDVARLISHLKKEAIQGLVIDLRKNSGGSLPEAVDLTGLFIPEGPVVQVRDNRGEMHVLNDPDPGVTYNGPLLVLTDRLSASASEILAGALQDYGRAVIVGEKNTFGKGTVQSVIELSPYLPYSLRNFRPGALKLTIQKFYRVSGGSTQNRGVIPDISLPSTADYLDFTESSLKNAMPYDEAEPAEYRPFNLLAAALPKLKEASAERVAKSPEFAYIREDIERLKAELKEKTISLNEKKRLEEKQADASRLETRKKERLTRKGQGLQSVEVTLQSIEAPPPKGKKPSTTEAKPLEDPVLEEGLYILSDLIAQSSSSQQAVAPAAGAAVQ